MRAFPLVALLFLAACQSPKGDGGGAGVAASAPRPVTIAGPDLGLTLTPDDRGDLSGTVVVDGTRSFMPGRPGASLSYRWSVSTTAGGASIDDPTSATPTLTVEAEGLHVFALVVIHQGVEGLPDRVTVAAERGLRRNTPPVAEFVVAPERPIVGLEIVLDGSSSYDEDPTDVIAAYLWEVEPPRPGELLELGGEAIARFTPSLEGAHTVRLVVTDNRGARTRLARRVFVATCQAVGDETCNGEDDDCDGAVDEGLSTDADGDGHFTEDSCRRPNDDCDDGDGLRFPAAVEICDNKDNDCDGAVDEGLDTDGDGVTPCAGDCDDTSASVHPGAVETCDGIDEDCDGDTDEGFDADGDGYSRCPGPLQDCDDSQASINPTAVERCDGIDNNCDGQLGFDVDGDGYSNCEEDCDDDATRNPGVPEIPGNGIDEDCDGHDALAACRDQDADGFCAFGASCDRVAAGCDLERWDCNDSVAASRPGAVEICDLRDNDCDGAIDEGFDEDGDGIKTCQGDCDDQRADVCPFCPELCDGIDNNCNHLSDERLDDCEAPCQGPGIESCNGIDDDCDGEIDEDIGVGDPCVRPICPGGTPGTWWCGEIAPDEFQLLCTPALIISTARDVTCLDFRRATPATYVADAAGTVAEAPAGEPRLQYDSTSGATHLLIEGARENLLFDVRAPSPPDWDLFTYRGEPTTSVEEPAGAPDGGAFTRVTSPGDSGGLRLWQPGLFEDDPIPVSLAWSAWLRGSGSPIGINRPYVVWLLGEQWSRQSHVQAHDNTDFAVLFIRRERAGDDERRFDLWGAQVERGLFPSSFIPRPRREDPGARAADELRVPPESLDPEEGTYLLWFNPMFASDTGLSDRSLLDAGGAVSVRLDRRGPDAAFECASGGLAASRDTEFTAGGWIFVGCTWSTSAGVRLFVRVADDLTTTRVEVPFQPAAAPLDVFEVAPTWALIGEVRLDRRAWMAAEVTGYVAETAPTYR